MKAKIAIMAGGTGGHVFPALAVANELRQRGVDVFWIGTHQGMEARLIPAQDIAMEWIDVGGVRGKGLGTRIIAPFRILRAIHQARKIMRRQQPTCVLGMGGFVAGPGGVAAKLAGIPLVIHEQNSIAGLTNKLLSRLASKVFCAFPDTFKPRIHAEVCGNPVRSEIEQLPEPEARGISAHQPLRMLVVGGSLGAQALNKTVPLAVANVPSAQRPEILHQTGEQSYADAVQAYAQSGVEAQVEKFITDMATAYAWADVVLCRSGALTISELAATGIGAILVPYPFAVDDHQTANAKFLVDAGAAVLCPQDQMTPNYLAKLLEQLLNSPQKLLEMAKAARQQAKIGVALRIADVCMALSKGATTDKHLTSPAANGAEHE